MPVSVPGEDVVILKAEQKRVTKEKVANDGRTNQPYTLSIQGP